MRSAHGVTHETGIESEGARVRLMPMGQRPRKSRQRGTALLEFAFTMVIALVLIFGIIDFGRALYSYHFVSNAAREATRFASVRGALCSSSVTPCPAQPADIQAYVMGIIPLGIDSTQVQVNPQWMNPNNLQICGTSSDYPGCAIQVNVTYNFNFLFPVSFYNSAPVSYNASSFIMGSTSQMIISR
jgi:Flp pilus assembly protein TadG